MGTGKSENRAYVSRPIKSAGDKRRRVNTHRKRLVELGVPEAAVKKMTAKDMRDALRHPLKTAACNKG
jgi:hypothetical protein